MVGIESNHVALLVSTRPSVAFECDECRAGAICSCYRHESPVMDCHYSADVGVELLVRFPKARELSASTAGDVRVHW